MVFPDSILNLPGEPQMLDVVRARLATSDDVCIAVSFSRCSGVGLLIEPLRDVVRRGGQVRILTSTYQAVTQPEALEALRCLSGVHTRVQDGPTAFHAKFWRFENSVGAECWAGSSNLSKGGLATNLEWNLVRADREATDAARRQFDGLWARPDVRPVTDEFLRRYRAVYAKRAQSEFVPFVGISEPRAEFPRPNRAQLKALARLDESRSRGLRRAAVIAATGVGKTYLAAFDVLHSGAKTAIYVSHRLEHLMQARRTFQRVLLNHSLGIVGGGLDEARADIVFTTIASLGRRPDLLARPFEYLVIDEFHHVEAPSYEVLRPLRERAFLLGITATPERQDGHDVLEWCDFNVAYEVRLPEAIERGWLLPFHYFGIADESVDFFRIPWRRLDEVEDALSVEARAAHVLQSALERGFDGIKRATIGFCAGKKHARFMADSFNRRGQIAVSVLGDQAVRAREAVYARLADPSDPLEWVFVSDILNEGVDLPVVNSVMFLRPTESATLFLQQLGRGLRLFEGTEVLTVLDFVGHHRSAWVTINALDSVSGGGRRTEVADGVVITPPRACEVVLERRTREILSKISRYVSKRQACDEAYRALRAALDRAPLPVDLCNRSDLPALAVFRQTYKSWTACQASADDAPAWARELPPRHPVFAFLRRVEANWQAQRVSPYALAWGLAARPDDPEAGYDLFFERWPQWKSERSALDGSKTWATVVKKLGDSLRADRLRPEIRAALGDRLLAEVEGRLLYTINGDHQQRHSGVLRTPADLNRFARYERPEIVRYFGTQYDPARHNTGMLWFGNDGVIITKLDTSTAKIEHQYSNEFRGDRAFAWTSRNKMSTTNEAGRRVVEHVARGRTLHLFVQPRSHAAAVYLGRGRVRTSTGDGPMQVVFDLDYALPPDLVRDFSGAAANDDSG